MEITIVTLESGVKIKKTAEPFADLSGLRIFGIDFSGMDLRGANFSNSSFVGCVFRGANLESANFEKAKLGLSVFDKANLTSVNMKGAILDVSSFIEANLMMADCTGASMVGVNMSGAWFEDTVLDQVIIDETTVIPILEPVNKETVL